MPRSSRLGTISVFLLVTGTAVGQTGETKQTVERRTVKITGQPYFAVRSPTPGRVLARDSSALFVSDHLRSGDFIAIGRRNRKAPLSEVDVVDLATGKMLDPTKSDAVLRAEPHHFFADRPDSLESLPVDCNPVEFASLHEPPRFFGFCSAKPGADQRYVLWSPNDVRVWKRPWFFLQDFSNRKTISNPVFSARGHLEKGEAGEEWLDLDRRILFVTPLLSPIDLTQTNGMARQFLAIQPKWPNLLNAVDLESETLDYVGRLDCPGYLELRDQQPGFLVVGCRVSEVPFDDGVWSEVVDLRRRIRWHTTIGIHRLGAKNTPIAHRTRKGSHEILMLTLDGPAVPGYE